MRTFVSVDLPSSLADPLEELQDEFASASGLRFTDPKQAHLTLKFLGEIDLSQVEEITAGLESAVATAAIEPFDAEVGGLGVFPDLSYISVVWVGIRQGSDRLSRLHEAIESVMVEQGFEPETHSFTPHITVARMDHAGGKEHVQQLVQERDPTIGTFHVDAISFTESTLTPEGPVYETIAEIPLSSP